MYRYLYGHDEIVAQFVAQLIPYVSGFGADARTIGVLNEQGHLIAGLVYNNYDADAELIEMHGASVDPMWLRPATLQHMYRYPFVQLGVQMLLMRTPIENQRVLRQLAAYNYTFVKVPRMFGRDKDGVLCLLTYEDWCANKINKRYKHHIESVTPLEEAA